MKAYEFTNSRSQFFVEFLEMFAGACVVFFVAFGRYSGPGHKASSTCRFA